jgi:YebC/PmpR family DNA-binding regulatory protein
MGRFATVAGRRATSADRRGRLFTKLSREIEISARSNPDPESNARLRLAILKAKQANMPATNIDRAITKASGGDQGEQTFELLYEAIGGDQESYLIEVVTDNKNRSHSEIRQILQKNQFQLTTQGSVSWNYERIGQIVLKGERKNLENVLFESIAIYNIKDYQFSDEDLHLIVEPEHFDDLVSFLWQKSSISVEENDVFFQAKMPISLTPEKQQKHENLLEKLHDQPEVQSIYHNIKEVLEDA